jgi:hypothetical protein
MKTIHKVMRAEHRLATRVLTVAWAGICIAANGLLAATPPTTAPAGGGAAAAWEANQFADLSKTTDSPGGAQPPAVVIGQLGPDNPGQSISVNSLDKTVGADVGSTGHTTIWFDKVSNALGVHHHVTAGSLWIDGDRVYLQWADTHTAAAAARALNYAALSVRNADGQPAAFFQFVEPGTTSIPVDKRDPIHVNVSRAIAQNIQLAAGDLSPGWAPAGSDASGELTLKGDEGDVRVVFNADHLSLCLVQGARPSREELEARQMDVEAKLQAAQADLRIARINSGQTAFGAVDTTDPRTAKDLADMQSLKGENRRLMMIMNNLSSKKPLPLSLRGAIGLVLPNGVCVNHVLIVDPPPPPKDTGGGSHSLTPAYHTVTENHRSINVNQ